jgi:hypothetical protein
MRLPQAGPGRRVTLSDRYISDRFLPDKAIDLVDEPCAMLRTEIDSQPTELHQSAGWRSRKGIAKEDDPPRRRGCTSFARTWPTCTPRSTRCARSRRERSAIRKVQGLREEIEQIRHEAEAVQRAYNLTRARWCTANCRQHPWPPRTEPQPPTAVAEPAFVVDDHHPASTGRRGQRTGAPAHRRSTPAPRRRGPQPPNLRTTRKEAPTMARIHSILEPQARDVTAAALHQTLLDLIDLGLGDS